MAEVHELGDERELTFSTTVGGAATDADAVSFTMLEPDGMQTPYVLGVNDELENTSTGEYRVLWICRKAGPHVAAWLATGTINQSAQVAFYVEQHPIWGLTLPGS
jgi:hypothetical protein